MIFIKKCLEKEIYAKEEFPQDEAEVKALEDEHFIVNRRLYNQTEFTKAHRSNSFVGFSLISLLMSIFHKNLKPSKECGKKTLYNRIPAIKWLKNYKSEHVLPDFLAGITVLIHFNEIYY